MQLSGYWLVPLVVGSLGGVALAVQAKRLDRAVRKLEQAMRPLRTTRMPESRKE
jgi:hypothetical protein